MSQMVGMCQVEVGTILKFTSAAASGGLSRDQRLVQVAMDKDLRSITRDRTILKR